MRFVQAALDILRERKKVYQAAFTQGTPQHDAFVDLARYCHAFDDGIATPDQALIAVGLRRAYFRIWNHLNLEPEQLAVIYKAAREEGND